MLRLIDNTKISFLKVFYLFCFVIFAGSATVFSRSLGDIRTIGNAFAVLLTVLFVKCCKIHFSKNFLYSILVLCIYATITTINNRLFNPLWFSLWLFWLTFAYCICRGLKRKMFVVYETVIVWLCVISVPLWLLTCVNYSAAYFLTSFLQFSQPYSDGANVAANMIVYTVAREDISTTMFSFFCRNCGFAWEPGAFSCFINLAIFCNLLRTKFRIRRNVPLVILFVTLLTTQSTTGILIFVVMSLVSLVFVRKSVYLILLIPVIVLLVNLPFAKDKFLDEYYGVQDVDINALSSDNNHSLGRMYSFKLDWEEFLRHPILGLGGNAEGTYLRKSGYDNIATISGIGKLLSMYGAIMTIVFVCLLLRSIQTIRLRYNTSFAYLLLVVIIGMMISYSLWMHPIFISFWMYGIYGSKQLNFIRVNKFVMKSASGSRVSDVVKNHKV